MLNADTPSPHRASRQVWAAPAFTALLSLITLALFFFTHSFESALPVFLCFLPMSFFFAAAAQASSQQKIRDLERRIEQLEARPEERPR